jgi:hypothetical protein
VYTDCPYSSSIYNNKVDVTMLRLYLSLAALVGFAIAQQPLGFVSPSVSATGSQQVQYVVGDEVAVEWTSPFEYTTLEVWQGPKDDGTWVVNTLAGA